MKGNIDAKNEKKKNKLQNKTKQNKINAEKGTTVNNY